MDKNTSDTTTEQTQRVDDSTSDQRSTSESQRDASSPTIEELKAKVAELSRENSKHRNRAKEQEQAALAAEQARLAEQGEFKKLAEQHAARVQELEPLAQSYTQLAELVSGQIEAQIKDWPQELKAFDPGKDAPIEQRLAWLEKSMPLLEKLQQQARSQNPGNSPNPRPAAGTPEDLSKAYEKKMRASGSYFKI